MPRIEMSLLINAPIERCFDLARSVDLHQISTASTKEYVIAGRKEGLMDLGEMVTWRAKHFGIWQELCAKITAMNPPFYFRDEMMKGTFQSFKHDHIFKKEANQTLMTDIFDFESPFGIIGRSFNALVLTAYMRRFLITRNSIIKHYAESEKWREVLK